jgi:hypothetical protein
MKLLYKPFSIFAGILGARAGRQMFDAIWSRLSQSPKPSYRDPQADLPRVVISAALEGATMAASLAFAHQLTIRLFHHLFGVWPTNSKSTDPA